MSSAAARLRAAEFRAALNEAVADAIEAGAIGFHLVALLPDGDYQDAYDCDDVLALTEAVNDSALKARIDNNRGLSIESAH